MQTAVQNETQATTNTLEKDALNQDEIEDILQSVETNI